MTCPHTPERYIMIRRPAAAHPTWLPVGDPAWRLVDAHGTMLRDSDGVSLRFTTDIEALEWLSKHDIPLLHPENY
jgi:hypothetical protein